MSRDFKTELNQAQHEAATAPDGPTLVIAGAGSGKTRTIVYRLAHLVDRGVPPERILLLTFTRRAAGEMTRRAGEILGRGLGAVRGGTFHSFAHLVLRKNHGLLGYGPGFAVLDQADAQDVLFHAGRNFRPGRPGKPGQEDGKDSKFPKTGAILSLISSARNREIPLAALLDQEPHLAPFRSSLLAMDKAYHERKLAMNAMDYDDLLFGLDRLLTENPEFRQRMRQYILHLLVDEYQDVSRAQARIVLNLTGGDGNVMAVGDEAQAIYGFRGADIRNILDFPAIFPGARVIRLEQNYRSTQPILDLANDILRGSRQRYGKALHTDRADGRRPELFRPSSDLEQARVAVSRIREHARQYPLHEIAVLFRAGYQSYQLEMALLKESIPFQKFGGQKMTEAAHVRDVMALLRLVADASDRPAWLRALSLAGIRGWQADNYLEACLADDEEALAGAGAGALGLLVFLRTMRTLENPSPGLVMNAVLEFYSPQLAARYPEDHPSRQEALDRLIQIAQGYRTLSQLLADMGPDGDREEEPRQDAVILSTVHSAKGLEWPCVMVIDLVEGSFPSRHALEDPEQMEEELRLLYVACTRARDRLDLFVPATRYNKGRQSAEPAVPCPFLPRALLPARTSRPTTSPPGTTRGSRPGTLRTVITGPPSDMIDGRIVGQAGPPRYCTHKVFGRGRILRRIPPNKYQVEFPGLGSKTILDAFLIME